MDTIQELMLIRVSAQELLQKIDQLIEQCQVNTSSENSLPENRADKERSFESVYPLNMEPGFFKGKSVIAVIFPDGVRIETPTWKRTIEIIMKRCNDDAAKHNRLMELRNRVQGRSRCLLGKSADGMRSPIKIDRGLYMESHYDTETLLRITKTRILDIVYYDYGGIQVAIRNR